MNDYLENLNDPCYLCEELLDFLEIKSPVKEHLIKEHLKALGIND